MDQCVKRQKVKPHLSGSRRSPLHAEPWQRLCSSSAHSSIFFFFSVGVKVKLSSHDIGNSSPKSPLKDVRKSKTLIQNWGGRISESMNSACIQIYTIQEHPIDEFPHKPL